MEPFTSDIRKQIECDLTIIYSYHGKNSKFSKQMRKYYSKILQQCKKIDKRLW